MKSNINYDKPVKKSWPPRIITLVVTFLAILYFYPNVEEGTLFPHKVGQVWDRSDLVTQYPITLRPDSTKMKIVRDSLDLHIVPVYTPVDNFNSTPIIESACTYVLDAIPDNSGFFESLGSTVLGTMTTRQIVASNIRNELKRFYKGKVISVEAGKPKPEQIAISDNSRVFEDSVYTTNEVIKRIIKLARDEKVPEDILDNLELTEIIQPNLYYNNGLTESRKEQELELIAESRTQVYAPGTRIVSRGEIVTPTQHELIELYTNQLLSSGQVSKRSFGLSLTGQAIYILLILAILVLYMNFYAPKVWANNRNFIFIISLVGLFVVISAIITKFMVLGIYIIPIVMVPILVQVFFHARMALWSGFATALLCAGMSANGMQYMVIEFVGISAAVYSLRDLTKRSQLLKTSLIVGIAYMVMYVAYQLMISGSVEDITGTMFIILFVNAVLTSICYVLMFGVERIFGFVSNVTLIELTDINTPLLRALSDECPGTFNHVMAVSNLADDAARQIGADALLTRAGAMYHDIGKLANPTFFTENQHGVNPHDGLDPRKSAEIIINHVPEGLRRAEKAGLPKVLRDFISEHHGAGKAKYFYFTYCKQHPDEEVDATPFTYPGPNPRSRETSILMMADAVEAASRSLKEHSEKAITDLVNNIINGQIADGLHNDSPLSFHDIQVIKNVFIRRLTTMYHSRIAYPDDPNKNKS